MIETEERDTSGASSNRTQDASIRRSHAGSGTFWQFLRFCLVGGANTLTDLLMLNILLWRFPTNNVQILVLYNSLAYTSGALSSFFLNKYWTFRRNQRPTGKEVLRFAISLFFEVLYSNVLVWLAGKALQRLIANPILWGNASKLIAVAIGTVISYSFMRFWTFAARPQDQAKKKTTHEAASKSDDHPASNRAEHAHHRTKK